MPSGLFTQPVQVVYLTMPHYIPYTVSLKVPKKGTLNFKPVQTFKVQLPAVKTVKLTLLYNVP